MNIQNALTFIFCSLCLVGCNTLAPKSSPEMVTHLDAQTRFDAKHTSIEAVNEDEQLSSTDNLTSLSKAESQSVAIHGDAWLFPYKLEAQTPLIFREVLTSYHFPSAAEIEENIAEKERLAKAAKEAEEKAIRLAKLEAQRNKPVLVKVNVRGKQTRKRHGKSKNLWDHVADGYSLTHIDHPRIDAAIKRYTKFLIISPKSLNKQDLISIILCRRLKNVVCL